MRHADSYYRRWVHVYEARLAGVAVGDHKGCGASVYAAARRRHVMPTEPIVALRRHGVWSGTDFFPNCYVAADGRFRGIIASVRVIAFGPVKTAVVCLGVGPKEYIEVIVKARRLTFAGKIGVAGRGQLLEEYCYLCEEGTFAVF